MKPGSGTDGLSIVAFGGNALQRPGEAGSVDQMRANLRPALGALEPLLRSGEPLCITHGNGPQVGNALLRGDAAVADVPPHPLDIAVATTQAEIGSLVVTELQAVLNRWGVQRAVAVLVTHVLVAADDPALLAPTKPIGPFYDEAGARSLQRGRGWTMVEDAGRGWRRVVGSPRPLDVLELASIRTLVEAGMIVIAAGGGGIPVAHVAPGNDESGNGNGEGGGLAGVSGGRSVGVGRGDGDVARLTGVEAVIDKDHTAALLACELGAQRLIMLTAVDCVFRNFGTDRAVPIGELTARDARKLLAAGSLPAGSMGPKVEAAALFAEATGQCTLITSEAVLGEALAGRAGTWITAR